MLIPLKSGFPLTFTTQNWSTLLHQQLQRHHHRACVVLCGESLWRWQQLQDLIPTGQHGLIVGEPDIDSQLAKLPQASSIGVKSLKHQLGQETDFAIFDAELGLDADALGIVIGMIRAGGCCYLCLPPKAEFLAQPNPAMRPYLNAPLTLDDTLKGFQSYLWQRLQEDALWLFPDQPLPALNHWVNATPLPKAALPTHDQQQAIDAIHHLAFGHRKRPVVLTADRGRGKSYTLGLACLRLLAEGKQHITLTAARRSQLESAFQAMEADMQAGLYPHLSLVEKRPYPKGTTSLVFFGLNEQRLTVQFQAPDALLAAPSPLATDVLMIDEAAHLPLPMLQALLNKHPRVLLSTTQQGYEGSGRGFNLKLTDYLNQHFANWKAISLKQPIRWNLDDPLETTLSQLLGFQALSDECASDTESLKKMTPSPQRSFTSIDPLALLHHPEGQTTFFTLFQLLSQAHYQTRPNDLMQLLEVPNQQLWMAKAGQQLIGVLRALTEGALPLSKAAQRHQGHLFPQLLAKNSHQPLWLGLKTLRIQRLAVDPLWQNQGIGNELLAQFKQAQQADPTLDALTTSFGASPGLVKFWGKAGFVPVHLGIQKDKASGLHSIAMIAPLSSTAQALTEQSHFANQFAWQLTEGFQHLETELVYELLMIMRSAETESIDAPFPQGYLDGQPFEAVSWALREWTLANPSVLKHPGPSCPLGMGDFWCQKVLQNHAWSSFPMPRKTLENQFKYALNLLLED